MHAVAIIRMPTASFNDYNSNMLFFSQKILLKINFSDICRYEFGLDRIIRAPKIPHQEKS